MSPFPAALASAQRNAFLDDVRELRASLNATLTALKGLQGPHLIGLDHVGYGLLVSHLNDAEAALGAALEAATDEAVQV